MDQNYQRCEEVFAKYGIIKLIYQTNFDKAIEMLPLAGQLEISEHEGE